MQGFQVRPPTPDPAPIAVSLTGMHVHAAGRGGPVGRRAARAAPSVHAWPRGGHVPRPACIGGGGGRGAMSPCMHAQAVPEAGSGRWAWAGPVAVKPEPTRLGSPGPFCSRAMDGCDAFGCDAAAPHGLAALDVQPKEEEGLTVMTCAQSTHVTTRPHASSHGPVARPCISLDHAAYSQDWPTQPGTPNVHVLQSFGEALGAKLGAGP